MKIIKSQEIHYIGEVLRVELNLTASSYSKVYIKGTGGFEDSQQSMFLSPAQAKELHAILGRLVLDLEVEEVK